MADVQSRCSDASPEDSEQFLVQSGPDAISSFILSKRQHKSSMGAVFLTSRSRKANVTFLSRHAALRHTLFFKEGITHSAAREVGLNSSLKLHRDIFAIPEPVRCWAARADRQSVHPRPPRRVDCSTPAAANRLMDLATRVSAVLLRAVCSCRVHTRPIHDVKPPQ